MAAYLIARSVWWFLVGYPATRYRQLLEQSEHWGRDQLEDYRNRKLQQLMTHCYQNVPYYQRVMRENGLTPQDVRRAEDLVKLPILTKDIIRLHSKELMARNSSKMKLTWSKTGGTTGEPIRIRKNIECVAWESTCFERGLGWGGLGVKEPRITLSGGSLGLQRARVSTRIGNSMRRDLFLPAFELRRENAVSYFDKIRSSGSRFLLGYASSIYRLALLAEETNQKLEFEAVFPTAELLLPEWEKTMRETFKCSVLPYYGCGEVNSLGFSTRRGRSYLIPEEHALLEVIERDGSQHLMGTGKFLVTDLDNYAMPLIRYANGDAGKITRSDGDLPFSQIERLDGRYNSFLMTENGDLISGAIGPHVLRQFTCSVKSYRVIQEEPLRIVIEMVVKDRFSEQDKELLVGFFKKYLASRMVIEIKKVPTLPVPPSGKSVFVINKCLK